MLHVHSLQQNKLGLLASLLPSHVLSVLEGNKLIKCSCESVSPHIESWCLLDTLVSNPLTTNPRIHTAA